MRLLTLTGCLTALILFTSCTKMLTSIKGTGPVIEKSVSVSSFTGIEVDGAIDVEVVHGETQAIIAKGHENIIDRLETNVKDGKWEIKLKKGNYKNLDLTIYITSPLINEFEIDGSGDIKTEGFTVNDLEIKIDGSGDFTSTDTFFVTNEVETDINGSGNIIMTIEANEIDTDIDGSGNITLHGSTNTQSISVNGSGNYNAFDLSSNTCGISINGSGDIEVDVVTKLTVSINGSGDVYYTGNAAVTTSINGSGNINAFN